MNWSSGAIPSITDKQNQLPLVILSTSFIHLTSSKTTSGKLSTEWIHFHKAQENFFGRRPSAACWTPAWRHLDMLCKQTLLLIPLWCVLERHYKIHLMKWSRSFWQLPQGREAKGCGFKPISLSPSVAILSRTIQ